MKKSVLALILFLLMSPAFAQKRASRIIFNGGVQKTYLFEGNGFQSFQCFEGCSFLNQTPIASYDFNALYQVYSRKPRLSFLYGVGINQKSFDQEIISSFGNPTTFRTNLKYLSLFYGINYDFPIGDKTKIIAGSLLNPEFAINRENDSYNSFGASIRMTMGLEYQVYKNLAFQLTPYFQSAIMNYANEPLLIGGSRSRNTYTPYAFGLNLGLVLNRIAD